MSLTWRYKIIPFSKKQKKPTNEKTCTSYNQMFSDTFNTF